MRKSHVTGHLTTRGVVFKRELSDGGIAGIVVGVIVGIALVALCSYPFIIRRIRRRKQCHFQGPTDANDPETGEAPTPGSSPTDDHQRRLSSQDSFKPSGENTRGGVDGSVKDLDWSPHDALIQSNGQAQTLSQPSTGHRLDTNLHAHGFNNGQPDVDNSIPRSAPFGYDGTYPEEYMPQSIGDAHDGTLNGTNADYYSPAVPSEAFGMFPTEEPGPQPQRSWSRGSSLKQNLKQIFSRKSTRDQSFSSPTSLSLAEGLETTRASPGTTQDVSLQRITTAGDPTESPTDITAPAADSLPVTHPAQGLGSPIVLPSTLSKDAAPSPPESSPTTFNFNASQSPPSHPAPGTVNPMDMMPASTERELWHKTSYQLYVAQSSPHQLVPSTEGAGDEAPVDSPSPLTLAPNTPQPQPQLLPVIQSPTPTQSEATLKKEEPDASQDILMSDIPSNNHLSPLPDSSVRHQSYPSDTSSPQPGPTSTNPSSLNTPATQLDTPSPHSGTSSDHRPSVSPGNGASNLSPRNGLYACDEPGCHQAFDQAHKLKYANTINVTTQKTTSALTPIVARALEPKPIFSDISMIDMRGKRSFTVPFQAATTQDKVGKDFPVSPKPRGG
ncbi:transcription factor [Fusarium longipes]|uniref:Transcription factor n=1 Tax=Fusarium longipes TaxID=694270 RepID=A0A395RSA7_9HYPO|nr:transcription factor [Fusarium longipes]